MRTRTMLVNAARGLTKSYGERLLGCNARGMKPKAASDSSPEMKSALEPLMREIESVSERISEYDQVLGSMAHNRYPEAERLKQIKGVGTPIALTILTLEDPQRFRKSLGCSLLRWHSARKAQLGAEPATNAYQQRGRSVSANSPGAGRAPHPLVLRGLSFDAEFRRLRLCPSPNTSSPGAVEGRHNRWERRLNREHPTCTERGSQTSRCLVGS